MSKSNQKGNTATLVKPQNEAAVTLPEQEPVTNASQLTPLAKKYIADAVLSATRAPSPNIKSDAFRTTLLLHKELTTEALKGRNEPEALIAVASSLIIADGPFAAVRYVQQIIGQMQWLASVDVMRARRTPGDMEHEDLNLTNGQIATHMRDEVYTGPEGLDPTRDVDYVAPPTEDEAVDAFVDAHSWVQCVFETLVPLEADRKSVHMDGGLPFGTIRETVRGVTVYSNAYSAGDAIEAQIEANEVAMRARREREVKLGKGALAALASMAK